MKVGKTLSIVVVGLASLMVIAALAIAVTVFAFSRGGRQQNFAPPEGQQASFSDRRYGSFFQIKR